MRRNSPLWLLVTIPFFLIGCGDEERAENKFDGLVRVYPPVNGFQLRGYDISDSYASAAYVELVDLRHGLRKTITSYSRVDFEPRGVDFSVYRPRLGDFHAEWSADGKSVKVILPRGAEPRNMVREVSGLTISYDVR